MDRGLLDRAGGGGLTARKLSRSSLKTDTM
jgi:hypothetical protein